MSVSSHKSDKAQEMLDLWWVVPGVIAGMPMSFVHPERRAGFGGSLHAYPDELPTLFAVGVRALVCLLPIASDAAVFISAGFAFHLLPVVDGGVPSHGEFTAFLGFVEAQRTLGRPVAVHCEAGIGRTGTLLAGYLIAARGHTVESAVATVRAARPGAIETGRQMRFLQSLDSARVGSADRPPPENGA